MLMRASLFLSSRFLPSLGSTRKTVEPIRIRTSKFAGTFLPHHPGFIFLIRGCTYAPRGAISRDKEEKSSPGLCLCLSVSLSLSFRQRKRRITPTRESQPARFPEQNAGFSVAYFSRTHTGNAANGEI